MRYSEIKQVKKFCDGLFSEPDWKEVLEHIEDDDDDFEVNDVRFIEAGVIDAVQEEELASDLYMLGCFNPDFLSNILGVDQDVIEAMQKAGAFEAIGKLIISMDALSEVQSEYASADGYGHHFNSYDGNEEELDIAGKSYYVFDNH